MKSNLHPNWQECTVTCACGNTLITHATTATMQIDICNKCHPFFTGEERFVDKQGRIDKFKQKMDISKQKRAQAAAKAAEKQAKKEAAASASTVEKKSFKQILNQAKQTQEKAEKLKKTDAKKVA